MSLIKLNYQNAFQVALMGAGIFLLFIPTAKAQPFPDGSTPKFFICSKGLTRFATLVTTKHDINLCGKDGAEATVLALRVRGTRKVVYIPLVSSNDSVYIAQSDDGTTYNLDTDKKLLIIKPQKGRILKEKVVASD